MFLSIPPGTLDRIYFKLRFLEVFYHGFFWFFVSTLRFFLLARFALFGCK